MGEFSQRFGCVDVCNLQLTFKFNVYVTPRADTNNIQKEIIK